MCSRHMLWYQRSAVTAAQPRGTPQINASPGSSQQPQGGFSRTTTAELSLRPVTEYPGSCWPPRSLQPGNSRAHVQDRRINDCLKIAAARLQSVRPQVSRHACRCDSRQATQPHDSREPITVSSGSPPPTAAGAALVTRTLATGGTVPPLLPVLRNRPGWRRPHRSHSWRQPATLASVLTIAVMTVASCASGPTASAPPSTPRAPAACHPAFPAPEASGSAPHILICGGGQVVEISPRDEGPRQAVVRAIAISGRVLARGFAGCLARHGVTINDLSGSPGEPEHTLPPAQVAALTACSRPLPATTPAVRGR